MWLENQKPGSGAWQIPQPGYKVGNDAGLQLEAYGDQNSVQHGQTIGFHVTTSPAQNYSVQIFRMGYYGGAGARLMTTSPQLPGAPQPRCPLDVPTGLIECHWATGWQVTVPSDWLSGLYLAVFTNASGYQWADPFTVTEPTRSSQIVLVDPVNNYEAYNEWPYDQVYGKNLYDGFGPMTVGGTARAVKVSFDRPFQQEYGAGERDRGSNWAARWLEQQGYDVTYATSTDMQQNSINLANYKVYVSPNHDEYWSAQMYDKIQNAEAAGLNLAFLSANSIYWQVRSEPSPSTGQPDRVVVCYKGTGDPQANTPANTILWRNLGRPEQALLGASYEWAMGADTNWIAAGGGGPAFPGAQLPPGAVVPKLLGVEADRVVPGMPGPNAKQFFVLSNSPFANRYTPGAAPGFVQESTLYQSATSNAWVFDAGTFNWGKGLADSARGYADGRVATMMANILGVMLGQQNSATIDRVAGTDRYGTAAAISRYAFPSGATSVYIANGTAFADALTGAPSAGHDKAPTLLTDVGALPQPTIDELTRVAPRDVYVLGGPAVVSDAVVAQLAKFTHGGSVHRLAGPDRFATAVAVSQHAFAPGVPVAYVAAGAGYPDAMAAGAAGARQGAPVLLTDNGALPSSTASELQRLKPAKIVILGGLRAVSQTVQDQLWTYAPTTRAAGPDRFQTAAALASMTQVPNAVDTVFIANGLTLADGLTGGAAAGLVGAPMLTTDSAGLDPWTSAEIRILNPKHIVILGGPSVVTPGAVGVMSQLFSGTSYRSFAVVGGAAVVPQTAATTSASAPPATTPSTPLPTTPTPTGTASAVAENELEELSDAASLVDAVFGAPRAKKDDADSLAEESEAEPEESSELKAEDTTASESEPEADEPKAEEASESQLEADAPKAEDPAVSESEPEADEPDGELSASESVGEKPESATEPADRKLEPEALAAEAPELDLDLPTLEPSPEPTAKPALTRTRLAAAAAIVAAATVASALVLFGGGKSGASSPHAAPTTTVPSVNPQAFYPAQSDESPYETGVKSPLTDDALRAAVPGCDASCKLVTRANGFSPDGEVLALFRTGDPVDGRSNAKLVVVGADGKLVWSAPDGFKALTAGLERFTMDKAGNFYLALPGAKTGQVLVILTSKDGKVVDLGNLPNPKITSDLVGIMPEPTPGPTATIVAQSKAGVPDADTGGLIESQYQIRDGAPVLVGCRRHVGESGQWITFDPSPDGCTHWPAGPVGPPDGDEPTTK